MHKRSEGEFKGFDNTPLFFQTWTHADPIGTIVLTHGQAEHSECYARLAKGLEHTPWNIVAWDLRGHGRSEGKRGYAAQFFDYVKDYVEFHKMLRQNGLVKTQKTVLLGHSLGGLIQLNTLIDYPEIKADAQVLSSPLMGVAVAVPAIKKHAAKIMNQIYPRITLSNELNYSQLTRDPEVLKSYPQDPLRHDRISPGVYLGFTEAMPYVLKNAGKITLPTFLQQAGADTVVSRVESEKLFAALGSAEKKIKIYEGAPHEVYNDIVREEAYQDLRNFLTQV